MNMTEPAAHTMRLILGDQLNASHRWFKTIDPGVIYVIAELRQETEYTTHHFQKIAAFFLAMQNFSTALGKTGHRVEYLTLDDTQKFNSLDDLLKTLSEKFKVKQFEYQRPDEYRLLEQMENLQLQIPIKQFATEHFLIPFDELQDYFTAGKHVRMENFYRKVRRRFNILMDDGRPRGGMWNYDIKNRNKLKKQDLAEIPPPKEFANNIENISDRIVRHKIEFLGEVSTVLAWPSTRKQARSSLKYFCETLLQRFGTFQDSMTGDSEFAASLYHSRLSFALNSKMLGPMEVVSTAISASEKYGIDISQVEGFVRQIIGWREYMRGIYWVNMPDYSQLNALEATRELPAFYWSGKTKMRCMRKAIEHSLEYSYAHHIQRLMITGNFALLSGIDPDELDDWYLGIYIDAIEWVEMPNTRGMSQFADGGLIATKPYVSSGNYINKMSDYCRQCHYDVKLKTGVKACPFNSLYWRFLDKHHATLSSNPRIGMVYRNWERNSSESRKAILDHADSCLSNIEDL